MVYRVSKRSIHVVLEVMIALRMTSIQVPSKTDVQGLTNVPSRFVENHARRYRHSTDDRRDRRKGANPSPTFKM